MNKPVVFSKQIHSSLSSVSSDDVFLSFRTDSKNLDFELIDGSVIKTKVERFQHLNGEIISEIAENEFLIKVYLVADKTFYTTFRHSDKNTFNALVSKYLDKKGWSKDSDYLSQKINNEQEFLESQLRRYQGFVIPDWNENLPVEAYRGALPDSVFKNKELQKYLANGGCFGYIGHSQRTYAIDRVLVKMMNNLSIKPQDLAKFVMHSAGRHFCDQVDCEADAEKYFEEYFYSMK